MMLFEADEAMEQIAGKVNNLARRVVPVDCTKLTAFIDVQGSLLYYVVCAFADDFTGAVIDYGTWPDQRLSYFALREAQVTLAEATDVPGLEAQIYAGLESLTGSLLGAVWRGEGDAEFRIERCLIDAGFEGDVVKQFCRQSKFAAQLTPSHGKGIGAGSNPLTPRKPADAELSRQYPVQGDRHGKTSDTELGRERHERRVAATRGCSRLRHRGPGTL